MRPLYSVAQRFQACVQAAAVLVYIFCGIFSSSFIVNFVVIVLLLTLDFWTVRSAVCLPVESNEARLHLHLVLQTKNVSGRLLVGLRWWNETTDEGSNWRFETLEEVICVSAILPIKLSCKADKRPYRDHTAKSCRCVALAGPARSQQEGLCMLLVVIVHHGEFCSQCFIDLPACLAQSVTCSNHTPCMFMVTSHF